MMRYDTARPRSWTIRASLSDKTLARCYPKLKKCFGFMVSFNGIEPSTLIWKSTRRQSLSAALLSHTRVVSV